MDAAADRGERIMSTVILDLEGDRLLAVEASAAKGKARVHRSFEAALPESLAGSKDHAAIGEWIRSQLDSNGIRGKSAIVAVSRGEVLVKRLDAPAGTLDRAERHEMIRLQMSRQASMTSSSSVVDYVEYEPEEGRDGFIVASAMPTDRVEARTAIVEAAGLRLEGIRLRTAGVRALLDHAFGDMPGGLGLHGVHCGIEPENAASVRVAQKCGFVHKPERKSHLKVGERWVMHEFYLATPGTIGTTPQ
jgi:Tfp pilus assembly PilM family ATPase